MRPGQCAKLLRGTLLRQEARLGAAAHQPRLRARRKVRPDDMEECGHAVSFHVIFFPSAYVSAVIADRHLEHPGLHLRQARDDLGLNAEARVGQMQQLERITG